MTGESDVMSVRLTEAVYKIQIKEGAYERESA